MKFINYTFIFVLALLSACNSLKNTSEQTLVLNDEFARNEPIKMKLDFVKGKSFNHPTFAIWLENVDGTYIKTLYVTQSYASGTFKYAALNDSTWLPTSGESFQPSTLPYWTYKKGAFANGSIVPSAKYPFVDAFTSATPKTSFRYITGMANKTRVRVLVEVNQPWDFNRHWTNAKLKNHWYKHSAQPSIIYAVTVGENSEYYLNPIGHGDPSGASGVLETNLHTLTSAKSIFAQIKLSIY